MATRRRKKPTARRTARRNGRSSGRRGAAAREAALIESVRQGLAIDRGETPAAREYVLSARRARVAEPPTYGAADVRRIRAALGVSQAVFAELLNTSGGTVRSWEQGVRAPDGPTRRLLEIAERHPATLLAQLRTAAG